MYRLAKTKAVSSDREKLETALIGPTTATKILWDHVRSGILVLSGIIAVSASAFAQSSAASDVRSARSR